MGSLVEVHRSMRPAVNVDARYNRALQHLTAGDVDQALAETMRLPGASNAGDWPPGLGATLPRIARSMKSNPPPS